MPDCSPTPGYPTPGVGLRRLAALVNEVLASRVTPVLGGFGPLPAGVMAMAPTGTTQAAARPRPRPHPASAPHQTPPPSEHAMDADHVETWRLVELAQAGDGEAFGQLYDRYFDTVYRFIYFRVNDRTLAEDFTSETFLRALRRISTISYQGRDIGAWFITIARNIILDHVKSARNRLEVTTGETIEGDDLAQSTESAVLEVLTSERLMQAVRQLGDEQRECVMLRFIQGLSVAETAQVMGKNDGAIKALQHRAVRKLADLIGSDLS
jgi:RNA polymerase sigma-70 factor, ECF subfamily